MSMLDGRNFTGIESPKYGKLVWEGVVRGKRLDASFTMVRDGKTLGEKWVLAGEK
jgi:hypothetical protein